MAVAQSTVIGAGAARVLAALALALAVAGCSLGYYAQAVRGQLDLLSRRQPIEKLIADPATDVQLKRKLRQVLAIREYASRELGLPDNGSYRSYADLERPYVAWNVFAAKEFSIEPEQWCFLVVGCVSYRGYFAQEAAERFAARLAADSYDVFVAPVPAYSTLGRFEDPVLNTMVHWDDVQLAAVVFHELTHQRIYFKNDAAASEALASVVEEEGVRRWLARQQRETDLEAYLLERQRAAQLTALIAETRQRLADLYASGRPATEMRTAKQAVFDRLRQDYRRLSGTWGDGLFDPWFDSELNNAQLISLATYGELAPGWQAVLQSVDRNLRALFARAEELAALAPAQRHEQLHAAAAGSRAAGPR